MRSKTVAYILWFFFGWIGAHKFYVGKPGMGIVYFFTLGLFGFGLLIDLFTLGTQVDVYNALKNPNVGAVQQQQNIVVNVTQPQQVPQEQPKISDSSPTTT